MRAWLDAFFGITAKGSSIPTELLAGSSTFLALSYIFVVNPAILAQAGADPAAVLFATIVAAGLATLLMGLWAKLPFAVAPGMEMNAYVAFFVVGTLGLSWQQALGTVFWSGTICVVLTLTRVRERFIDAVPVPMKTGLSLAVGLFLALVALKVAGLLLYKGTSIHGLGNLAGPGAWALYISVTLILILDRLRVPGAVLAGMVITSLACPLLGLGNGTAERSVVPGATLAEGGSLDLGVIFDPRSVNVVLILFLLDFYGSIAKFIGLTANTNMTEDGKLPRMKEALLVDGAATMGGALLGTTSLITYVESAVGIGIGGRTGLSATVCGLMMLSCFFLAPVLRLIPVEATTGALIFVTIKLSPGLPQLRRMSAVDRWATGLMQLIVVATFAIDRAMLAGFLVYVVASLCYRQRPNPYLVVSTGLLLLGSALQFIASAGQ